MNRLRSEQLRALLAFVPRRFVLVVISAAGLISGAAQAAFVLMLGRIAAALASDNSDPIFGLQTLGAAFAVCGAFVAIMVICYTGFSALSARLLGETTAAARSRAMHKFLSAGWESQAHERHGELQEIVNGHVNRIGLAVNSIAQVILALTSMVILLVVATVVSPITAGLVVVASAPLFAAMRPVFGQISDQAALRGDASIELGASVAQTVSLSRDISVFGVNDAFREHIDKDISDLTKPIIKGHFYRVGTPFLFQVIVFALMLFGLVATWRLGVTDLEQLSITVLLFLRAMMYGRDLQRGVVFFADAMPFIREYKRRLETFVINDTVDGDETIDMVDKIELRNYGYSYPDDPKPILKSVSFTAHAGDAVGIIGPSGSGKSTLAEVLLRLRRGHGDYFVNGRPASQVSNESWTSKVAYVSQSPALLHATVSDNIRFLRDGITDSDIKSAAKLAQVHAEIEALPNGYDTILGGLTGQLSGGQAQRVCIARALAGNPLVLVMDEPTSALDAESETQICRVLANLRGHVTSFVITHRMAAVAHCNRIVHLEAGNVVKIAEHAPDRSA